MNAGTYALIICSPIHLALNHIFVYSLPHLGFIDVSIAISISYWLIFSLLIAYIAWIDCMGRVLALSSTGDLFKLIGSGILMVGTEWIAFEIVTLAADLARPTLIATQSVAMTTDQVLNTLPFGISIATSNCIDNRAGCSCPLGAETSVHLSAFPGASAGIIVMLATVTIRDTFGYLFSCDESLAGSHRSLSLPVHRILCRWWRRMVFDL
ncbi:hypothetical protein BX666DRAFT_2065168, partial [Dichotomocladium elegans]